MIMVGRRFSRLGIDNRGGEIMSEYPWLVFWLIPVIFFPIGWGMAAAFFHLVGKFSTRRWRGHLKTFRGEEESYD